MKKSIVVLVLAAAVGYFLLGYHIILLDNTITFIKKSALRYEDTFVDARGAKKLELLSKPALLEAGLREALQEAGSKSKEE